MHPFNPFNGPLSGTTRVSRYQKGKTNLDFTEVRDSEWQWHQLGRMQVCTSLQTDNHASTPPLSFLQAGCPSCRPTNSIKALKEIINDNIELMQSMSKCNVDHRTNFARQFWYNSVKDSSKTLSVCCNVQFAVSRCRPRSKTLCYSELLMT